MKIIITSLAIVISVGVFAQKALVLEKNGKFGITTDFGKELLPAEYDKMREIKTDTLDFYIAHTIGTAELYSYNTEKRSIFEETQNQQFSTIEAVYSDEIRGKIFYGYDKVGNKFKFTGAGWEKLKTKGDFIGGKNQDGKYAVCQKGEALTDYIYNGVNAELPGVVQVLNNNGWQALDTKLKPIYDQSYDQLWTSKTHPAVYIVRQGKNWGIFSTDGSMALPMSPLRNPEKIFEFNGQSLAELERGYAYEKGGKYGISDNTGKEMLAFSYDDAYAFAPKEVRRHGLEVIAVAKQGTAWKFFNEKYKEVKSVEFDSWIGLMGEEALVVKDGKMHALNLKTFEFERSPFFNDWDQNTSVETDNGHEGLVSPQGDIILGFDNDQVHVAYEDTDHPFVIVAKNGKDGIHDINGKQLVAHNYETLYELCNNGKHYFAMGKLNEKLCLAYWDESTNKIVSITKPIYTSINCYGKVENGFSATTLDGDTVELDTEGKVKDKK